MAEHKTTRSPSLILASNSPRRRQLMALGGWNYIVQPAQVNEDPYPDEDPRQYVERMAISKAHAVADESDSGVLVIGADTTVVHRNEQGREVVLGKPSDHSDAFEMLARLRGTTHQVYTAVAVVLSGDGTMLTEVCCTDVKMRQYSDDEIEAYIASGDPFDKAGAYAIQHDVFNPAESVKGCYPNVVGLPLCMLTRLLRQFDVLPASNITRECNGDQNNPCLVYSKVLIEGD